MTLLFPMSKNIYYDSILYDILGTYVLPARIPTLDCKRFSIFSDLYYSDYFIVYARSPIIYRLPYAKYMYVQD